MDDEKFFDSLHEAMKEGTRERHRMEDEFKRLACEPCGKVPNQGDRVVVAIGFLGFGHLWVREEATVLEAGDTSYKVQLSNYRRFRETEPAVVWVHQALITDVLGPTAEV